MGGEDLPSKLRSGELRVRNTKPACPPHLQILIHSSPISKKKRGKIPKKRKKEKENHIHSFRKQFYVTYKWKKKGVGAGVGVNTIRIPNTQYFTSWRCISITIKLHSPVSLSLSKPLLSLPPIHASLQCSFSRHSTSSDRGQSCRSAGPRDWGGNLCRRKREFICGDCFAEGVMSPLLASVNSVVGGRDGGC